MDLFRNHKVNNGTTNLIMSVPGHVQDQPFGSRSEFWYTPTTMDVDGFSQIGRYGTISLMKSRETDTVVTAFGVDTEEVTFGRDPGCSVRLYYPDVDLVHCKITFKDRKASHIS